MFGINLKHSLAIVAVATGLLATAGPASAGTHQYQHDQTDLEFVDGTSNTIMFGVLAASETAVIESLGTKY